MSELSKEVGHVRGNDLIFSSEAFEKMNSLALLMADGTITTPKHLQGKPADCFAIILQAMQWQLNPFVVAQKTHIVNGTLGYEAQLVNAILQSSGLVLGQPEYEYKGAGEQMECRVAFVPAGKTDLKWGEWLMLSQVTIRNSPLWKTNPKQQIGYLQVKNWARANSPGAILGVYSVDELQDSTPEKEINPPVSRNSESERKGTVIDHTPENIGDSITHVQLDSLLKAIEIAGITETEFCANKKIAISCLEELPQAKFEGAINMLKKFAGQQ